MAEPLPTFDAVFESMQRKVLGLCLHVVGERQEAEDALQEAFLAVYRGLPAFRGEAQLSTWVFRIALRAALRVRSRRPPLAIEQNFEPASERPEQVLEARDEARRLERAMSRLPAEQRTVLALFAVDGLGHREIAEVLGVPEGTVWSRLHLARKRLAAELASPAQR